MAAASVPALGGQAPAAARFAPQTLVLDGLGKGAAPLDGPWQFHPGDDPAWASPDYDDSQWVRLTPEQAAQAAVNFGQDDDITVLTLTRLALGAETAA
jgi:hypothetical protein